MSAKNKIPRSPGGPFFSFSRGKILDATTPVYFGPGQGIDNPYVAPTDWPGVGMLLRLPQVACLVVGFQQTALDHSDPDLAGYGAPMLHYDSVRTNVTDAFNSAKATIEALRPGKTFVNVNLNTFGLGSPFPIVPIPDTSDRGPGLVCNFMQIWAGEYVELPGGPGSQISYLGPLDETDPSKSFIGQTPLDGPFNEQDISGLPADVSAFPPINHTDLASGGVDLASISAQVVDAISNGLYDESPCYGPALGAMPDAFASFANYGVHLYGIDIPSDPGAPTELDYVADAITDFRESGHPDVITNFPAPLGNKYSARFDLNAINTANSGTTSTFLDSAYCAYPGDPDVSSAYQLIGPARFSDDIFTQMARDFAGFNVQYKGAASTLTADSVVREIADFFGFDPETGLDLG